MAVVTFTLGIAAVGGIAANTLMLLALIGLMFGGQGSQVSKQRRFRQDSNARLFGLLFVVGAVIGCGFALVAGFADWFFAFPAGVASFVIGSIIAYRTCVKLNEAYFERALQNLEQGDYKGAIEDAMEVARSSEALRSEANTIIAQAQELRRSQPTPAAG